MIPTTENEGVKNRHGRRAEAWHEAHQESTARKYRAADHAYRIGRARHAAMLERGRKAHARALARNAKKV